MVEIAISVLAKIAEYTVAPIGRQFGYLFCYHGNIEKLSSENEKLEDQRVVVQRRVDEATTNGQRIRPNVDKWLVSVEKKQIEAAAILGKKEKVGKGCLNLKSRYWESRKATKRSQDLANLEGEKFNEVADNQPPLGIVPEQSPIVVETPGDGISEVAASYAASPVPDQTGVSSSEGLDSRLLIMRDVMEAVKDDKIRMIGICGMGGVGKTTIVKEVERRAKLDNSMFDEVVMTAVSKDPDVKKIQEDIAELLGLKFQEQNPRARAVRLCGRLTQKGSNGKPKRILIILDDLWNKLNLEEVGIPYEDSDHNSCKIVLTSRRKNVCDQMKTKKTFSVEVLPPQEARSLFRKINDYSLHASTDMQEIAEDIVKECGGLPIAIENIASALVNQVEATWKDVRTQLKNSALEGEDYAVVYKTLEVSYRFLKTKEIKDFFLLCCLFPEDFDISIEDLVRYGMGLRLFNSINNLQEARNRAHAHVGKLKDSYLLLRGKSEEFVKIHDLVRDFALSITTKGDGENVFMVKFDNRLKEWPIDTCMKCTSISFQCDEIHELPLDRLKCPNVTLLRLITMQSLKFPDTIYEGMEKLQVLALTMSIQSLPGSLKFLTNLRTLSLDDCTFKGDISMIGNLVNLELLSLVKSDIKELPREIRKLTRLRLLDLTWCRQLRRIAPDVLRSLSRLEELYMMGSSFRWAQQAYVDDGTNASFDELKQLSNLVNIEIDMPYEVLPIDLTLRNLQNFKISTAHGGGYLRSDFHSVIENRLKLKADRSVLLVSVLEMLCRKTEVLYLRVKDLKNLPTKLERDGFFKLRSLEFESCDELVSIVNPSSNLEGICGGQLPSQDVNIPSSSRHQLTPFGNLQDLKLCRCNKLKNIFPVCIARVLIKLKSLEIKQCQMMEEIIFKERGDEGKIEFPHLEYLRLEGLPNLIGFSKAVEEVELPQLEYLYICGLPKLTSLYPDETESLASEHPLFNKKVKLNKEQSHEVLSRLKEISLDNLPNLKHVWKRGFGGFQNLTSLTVRSCERLETVFSPSIARRLVTLQSLRIENCEMMESILSNESGEDAAVPPYKIEFPNLKYLSLRDLPNLVCFSKSADGVELPQLKLCKIYDVPKLGGLYPEETVTLASDRHYAASPKNPFFNSKVTLTNLETLNVRGIDHLATVFPALVIQQLHNLGELDIRECSSVEVVFDLQGLNVNEGPELVPLTRLNELRLSNLPKLTHVWKKGPHIIQGFQNLATLTVDKCDSLRHLFTLPMCKILVALEELKINGCMLLEAIVAKEEGGEEDEEAGILFPQLTTLCLANLPNLLILTPKWLKWSSLKRLTVSDCGKESGTLTHTLREGDISQQITVTNVAKREVSGMKNLNEISATQCDTQVSREATNCERQILTLFPTNVIQQLQNLDSLELGNLSSVEVAFDLQGLHVNEELAALTQLRTVVLGQLPKLTHVWKKSVHRTQGFQNLTWLTVSGCDSLKHVFTYSMAKILVGLRVLEIGDCMLLEAVVAKEGGEEEEECTMKEGILFPHLTCLNLKGLPNLLTIPYTFNWSSSTDSTMNDMVREGDTAQQDLSGSLWLWECNSVEVVFDLQGLNVNEGRGLIPLTRLDGLRLSNLPKLTHVWKKGPHIIQGFQNLKTLTVDKCDSLRHLFTPSIAKILVGLQLLKISDCELLEAIVTKEEGGEEEEDCTTKEAILFPQLTRLSLSRLPNLSELPKLTHVWKKGPHIIQGFQNLTTLEVDKCDSLRHLFTPSLAKILVALKELKIDDCKLLEAIVAKEEGGEEDEEAGILFPQLTRLSLSRLPNLSTITPKPYTFNWAFLVQCDVKDCGKGEEILNDIIGNRNMARLATEWTTDT